MLAELQASSLHMTVSQRVSSGSNVFDLGYNMVQNIEQTDATTTRIHELESAVHRLAVENDRLKTILSFKANTLAGELLDAEDSLDQGNRDLRSLMNNMSAMIGHWDKNLCNRFGNTALISNYVAVFSDATSRKASEEERQSLAFSDPLTGLPNRQQLMVLLQQAQLARAQLPRIDALLLVDLDQFNVINAAVGQANGNQLLQIIAHRLGNCIRKRDSLVCLGGNAFVVVLQELSLIHQQAANEAEVVAGKIVLALNQPYHIDNSDVHCSACIGISLIDVEQQDTETPLNQAELALHYAKSTGRNAVRFYDPKMQNDVSARVAIESELSVALLNEQFALRYQPQLSCDGRIIGVEALVRWLHPVRGIVSPAEFIPVAEKNGLIISMDNWVLETVCRQLALWASKPVLADLSVAINVSAHPLLQVDFAEQVLAALERTGADPRRLKIEVTESSLISNLESVAVKMKVLKVKGVSFALDDFGTGYSSLSCLKKLPLEQLKIDQSFVRNILTDPTDAAIAKMVVALADSLSLTVIAEGVETEAQRDFLASLGCLNYQGHLFSKPLPIEEFEAFVTRG